MSFLRAVTTTRLVTRMVVEDFPLVMLLFGSVVAICVIAGLYAWLFGDWRPDRFSLFLEYEMEEESQCQCGGIIPKLQAAERMREFCGNGDDVCKGTFDPSDYTSNQ